MKEAHTNNEIQLTKELNTKIKSLLKLIRKYSYKAWDDSVGSIIAADNTNGKYAQYAQTEESLRNKAFNFLTDLVNMETTTQSKRNSQYRQSAWEYIQQVEINYREMLIDSLSGPVQILAKKHNSDIIGLISSRLEIINTITIYEEDTNFLTLTPMRNQFVESIQFLCSQHAKGEPVTYETMKTTSQSAALLSLLLTQKERMGKVLQVIKTVQTSQSHRG